MPKTEPMENLDKEKIFKIVDLLIGNPQSRLDTKFLKSHEKVAIIYKSHTVEIVGGEKKVLKYLTLTLPIKKKEYKQLLKRFLAESKSRKDKIAEEGIKRLEELL